MDIFPLKCSDFLVENTDELLRKIKGEIFTDFPEIRDLSKEIWQRLMAYIAFLLSTAELCVASG